MRAVITNAFSINMLNVPIVDLTFQKVPTDEVVLEIEALGSYHSIIGHKDMAMMVQSILGIDCPMNRETYTFDPNNDVLIIAQYKGPRLEEGTTVLPEGSTIEFWLVAQLI